MTNLLCDSIDFATKFEEDRKSETCSVQFKQQIKTRILAGITLHKKNKLMNGFFKIFQHYAPLCVFFFRNNVNYALRAELCEFASEALSL